MQMIVTFDCIWCYRLQLTLVLCTPMSRRITWCGISEWPVGVHEFGITFLVGNVSSPCGDQRATVHHTRYFRVHIVPKDCVCPILNSGSRDTYLNPVLCGACPSLCGLTSGADNLTISVEYYDIRWNVIADNDCIKKIIVIVDRIWFCNLQLTLVLGRIMYRHLTYCGFSDRPMGSAWIRYNVPCGEPK
jgi:hypothetical protein